MPHLTWSRRALADLARLGRFLRGKSPAAAKRAVTEIRTSVSLLQRYPQAGRPVDIPESGYRELPVPFGASGYVVYYQTSKAGVTILAIRHAREEADPAPGSNHP